MSLLKLIGVLLDYPRDELWEHGPELLAACDDPALAPARQRQLRGFVQALLDSDPLDAQARWLGSFDRGRSMSLLLFEHIHGESRDRGQAMVDLVDTYRRNGFELDARELPDYLPLLLEFLAHRPQAEARDWLHHVGHIAGMLAARAAERELPHAVLLEILVEAGDGKVNLALLRQRASEEARDDTREAMDRLWEEEAVRFGSDAPAQDCAPPRRSPARPSHPEVQP
ncbi:MAG: nitrate reductase molybdenum cofactor assembly chaperone [Lysobacteraceae bacterium SCN 69-123]|jgi:nitrate reductase delta subunit|uniref:Respiratory nitrate reductase subunit delta n=1 Tax=Stenotrophomonas acidaminiphila TaxID=128780 RepID=A0A0R0DY07_9GAMM|nr:MULTISPECIES: nitrate reductase molybdenum cofactor assembly chaperone [Stenotrophomonas]ODU47019.1 MAG: nitrate reductase molybdenum cofactor assembly chaperone [Xanthomonadaceae bacterium SCN 69-123]OJY72805.1 MAG: nitrate reductase molybdenum cofactor assembly chaperone [Stenotrophomonas sp. 69-14]ALJ29960.1 respiratory nitrate reductase subunit delta [Stenotrophomonas acidaminiphila]KRG83922.1 nitrate reductase [Stenotrophomonas acidaminiphila]MBN8802429.1 nitrate reductase molybdenum c